MDADSSQQLIFMGLLLIISAFFSLSEAALTSLSKIRLRNMIEENVKGSDKVDKLLANPKKLLGSILFGNILSNAAVVAIATKIAIPLFTSERFAVCVVVSISTFFILIFTEITPKFLGTKYSDKISLFVATPINVCIFIFLPFVNVVIFLISRLVKIFGIEIGTTPLVTESELITMLNVSHEEGVLEVDERRMINNVFEFGDYCAKDVMTPRTNMVAIDFISSFDEISQTFEDEQFSRMPVYKDNIDNIVGVIHLKDFVFSKKTNEDFNIEDYMRKPHFTYEAKPTSTLFSIMRTKQIPLTIVLDEYGGTSGLITLEDLVEQIVGDITDEYDDNNQDIEVIKEDEYVVDGTTKISDVNEMIGTNLESEDFDSIGGFVLGAFGRIPEVGETIMIDNIKFIVESLDKNRIAKLRIYT